MWVALYVAAIVAVNWMFTAIAPWSTPLGDLYLANVVVGFIFVLRDYAQREVATISSSPPPPRACSPGTWWIR